MSAEQTLRVQSFGVFWGRIRPVIGVERWRFIGGLFFELLSLGATVSLPQLIRIIVDDGLTTGSMDVVRPWLMLMVGLVVVQSGATFMRTHLLEVAAQRVASALRRRIFKKLINHELGFFDDVTTGELTARMSGDIAQLVITLRTLAPELIHFGLMGLIAGGLMIYTAPMLSGLVLLVGPAVWLGSSLLGRFMRRQSTQVQTRSSHLTARQIETISGIQTVRVYNQENATLETYAGYEDELVGALTTQARAHALMQGYTNLLGEGAVVLGMWLGGMMIVGGTLTTGSLVTFILYATMVMRAIRNTSHAVVEVMRAQGATERIFELSERESRMPPQIGTIPSNSTGGVQLEDVHFTYPTRPDAAALHGINLDIPSGEVIALVGSSGSGKSTIAKLIARLYDPDSGKVMFDGVDLRELDTEWLRKQVTLVPAEATLFACSLADNICYGRPDATASEVEEAAKIAHAAEFIEQLPEGYETNVGDSGRLFSSGQRQRIAIARAILRAPRVLILDEATAALDSAGEALVKESLRKMANQTTVIMVSHRLSTILDADRIVLVRDGRLVGDGTHIELLATSNFYRDLVENQLASE
jgi:ABC-type multidrug transport system fused ATPase/permease subunit